MKILVALAPNQSSDEALALAIWFVGRIGGGLVVATIMPELWETAGGIDREYGAFLQQRANDCLRRAEAMVASRVPADYVARAAPSIRKGLVAAAMEVKADYILIGSAAGGPLGRFLEGSLATELLRGSPFPLLICPQGYAAPPNRGVERVSVAYSGDQAGLKVVDEAASIARALHAPLRIISFVLHDRQMYPSLVGYEAEQMVIRQLKVQLAEAHETAASRHSAQQAVETTVGEGENWAEALLGVGWSASEFLVVGASSLGPVAQVFLGSNATKIVRNSSVPCLLWPRLSLS